MGSKHPSPPCLAGLASLRSLPPASCGSHRGSPCALCPSQSRPGIPRLQQGGRKGHVTSRSPRRPLPHGVQGWSQTHSTRGRWSLRAGGKMSQPRCPPSSEYWWDQHMQGGPTVTRGRSRRPLQPLLRRCSCVRLRATPGTAAHQAPLSTGFSWQEHWSGSPCPPPGDLSSPGIEATFSCVSCAGGRIPYHQRHLGTHTKLKAQNEAPS